MKTLIALLTVAAAGCSTFYDQDENHGITTTVYSDLLPSSVETVFAECVEPLQLTGDTDEIDFAGSCDQFDDVAGTGPQLMLLGLLASGPIELGGEIGSTLASGVEVIDNFPWPLQNCEVELDYEVRLNEIDLYDLMAGWRTHDGEPSLWIDFDFDNWANVADFRVVHDVDCPSWINENALTGLFNVAIPSGWREVTLNGLDLDLWVTLANGGSQIDADLDIRVGLSEISTDTYLSNLPGNVDQLVLNALGLDIGSMQDTIEAQLSDALTDLPDAVADLLNDALPDGHVICDIGVESNELVITSDDPGRMSCSRWIVIPRGSFRVHP